MGYIASGGQTFGTIADLQAQAGSDGVVVYVTGKTTPNDGDGGNYMWNAASTAAANGSKIVQVAGVSTGRWMRLLTDNYATGSSTFSSLALTSVYVVNHGLNFTPSSIQIQARSANAAVPNWITNITATSFTINFASIPLLGTLNLVFNWIAFK